MAGFLESLLGKLKGSSEGGLSKYSLLRTIGKGTMSNVFLARDSKGNSFAVKILRKDTTDLRKKIDSMRGGKSEGELALSFQHPNIVFTIEWGFEGKEEFIVMELIEGIILKNLVGSDAPEIRKDPIKLFINAGSALSYIHKAGYIHRDFCPKNIFLTKDGRTLLFDFGLTVSIESASVTKGRRTGTASYMAPELIKRARTDHRTDIYSFGVTMYETLTGVKPFGGSGTIEKMIQLLNAEPRNPRELNPDISEEVAEIVLKCLAKDPDKRLQSADKVIMLLENYRMQSGLPPVRTSSEGSKRKVKTPS